MTTLIRNNKSRLWTLPSGRVPGHVQKWVPRAVLLCMAVVVIWWVARHVIWPGYTNPQSRIYESRWGYAAALRHRHQPFPVTTARPEMRSLGEHFVGEGFVRSTPILIPIVPISRIERVHVDEGDKVKQGDLLAELDKAQARLRLESAQVMLEVARAELKRTKIGSSYLLEKERPEKDKIRYRAAQAQVEIRDELKQIVEKLFETRAVSRVELLEQKANLIDSLARLREAEVALQQSQRGREQSIRIAAATVREAELAVNQRQLELSEHDVWAPDDGIIERRLAQEGEYNQDPGKPGFLLASGLWFEAHFDQTVTGKLAVGDACSVRLEAFAGIPLTGQLETIHPFVSFNSAGPETPRPIRPSGTGSPEWPSTFAVRIRLDPSPLPIATGLSGLAKIERQRQALAVPAAAVVATSATDGWVYVVSDQQFDKRHVTLGCRSAGWTEITSGLTLDDEVIVSGHHALQPGDRIDVQANAAVRSN